MAIKLQTYIEDWNGPNILDYYEAISDQPYSLFFDSNDAEHPLSQFSFICWNPREVISYHNNDACPFELIQKKLDNYQISTTKTDIPFTGGLAGYWGYDLGRTIEELPNTTEKDIDIPELLLGIYTNILAHNHKTNKTSLIILAENEKELFDLTEEAKGLFQIKKGDEPKNPPIENWQSSDTEDNYKNKVQKIIDYIYNGDVYQVNLSHRFSTNKPKSFNAFAHYKNLRKTNSAPFSSYMNFSEFQISSCSPERFLSVQENKVETRPIKGTISDTHLSSVLENSEKDRAENIMIVDLLRNDISKSCKPHSVNASNLCEVETFKGLHHLVSTISGELRDDKNTIDLLKSCFPGGSITGAPKIRAMEIIEELEPYKRGVYCGSLGYIGFDGTMDTNIVIRTLIYTKDKIYLQAGGGITCESNPEKELQETYTKIDKIFESFK